MNMRHLFPSRTLFLTAILLTASLPGMSHAATFTVTVFSLQQVFIGADPNPRVQAALAANPITLTIRDRKNVDDPVTITLDPNNINQITFPGNALTLVLEFRHPNLDPATLDGV